MGQKVNPHGFRVGPTLNKDWDSVLYAENDYAAKLLEDLKIRALITKGVDPLQPKSAIVNEGFKAFWND